LDGKVARQYNSHLGWTNYRDYIHRGATLFATADSAGAGGAVRHLHLDHLGTPRLITDASGSPATATFHTYYPFGEEIAGTYNASYTERLRFTGHERDLVNPAGQGDDLDYMHARHCSPIIGRFLSTDLAQGKPTTPQSWNRYAYALGNPMKHVDPDGKESRAAIQLDQDIQAVLRGEMSREEFNERNAARAAGAAIGASIVGGFFAAEAAITALAVRLPTLYEAGVALLAGLAGAPTVSNPISGEFAREFTTSKGNLKILSNAVTEGTTLTLKDSAIYGDKAKLDLGAKTLLGLVKQLGLALKELGYTRLVIEGIRYSGANPGKTAQIVVDLTKLKK
jgi:RHS repeat-associated protein